MKLYEPARNRRDLAMQLVWFVLWLGVTGVALYLEPSPFGHGTHQQLGFPPCPTVLIFDRPCPGCGMTTSWSALVHGQFLASWRSHPMGPLSYGLFTGSAILSLVGFLSVRRLVTESRLVNWGGMAFGLLFLAFGLIRTFATVGYADQIERMYPRDLRPEFVRMKLGL
ncbi:MAG TPA: DUF2752 domain-containing protein [Fimbriimonas sp.]